MTQNSEIHHDQIAAVASGLWEEAGRPAGRDMDFWLEAEQQLQRGRIQQKGATRALPLGSKSGLAKLEGGGASKKPGTSRMSKVANFAAPVQGHGDRSAAMAFIG